MERIRTERKDSIRKEELVSEREREHEERIRQEEREVCIRLEEREKRRRNQSFELARSEMILII